MLKLTCCIAAALVLTLTLSPHGVRAESWDDPATYRAAQEYMLELINRARAKAGEQTLKLDLPAGQVAKLHAADMLQRDYFSHWNPEGIKPTRRWNLLGGFDCVSENIYYTYGRWSNMERMVDEAMKTFMKSPGHKRTLLDPAHTHVGVGYAVDGRQRRFYVNQTFVTRIGGEYTCPPAARPGEAVQFSGRFDPARYSFGHVLVGYEDLPRKRDKKWLDKQDSYSDSDRFVAGYSPNPRIRFGGFPTSNSVEVDNEAGSFRCDARLDYKGREGLYYLYTWLRDKESGREVLAAVATVEVRK